MDEDSQQQDSFQIIMFLKVTSENSCPYSSYKATSSFCTFFCSVPELKQRRLFHLHTFVSSTCVDIKLELDIAAV